MPTFGRQVLGSTGRPVQVTADGSPEWKTGGLTIDWATVTAEATDRTLGDGTVIKAGMKGIEFGTVLAKITASGKYGPAASTAADGRQTLARGACFVLNESVTELGPLGLGTQAADHPGVFDGGKVWRARLKIGGANPTSIGGNQPTAAAFDAAFPRIQYVDL
jgi:hypothetical protein